MFGFDVSDPRIIEADQEFEETKEHLKKSFKFFVCYAYSRMNNGATLLWPSPPGRTNHLILIIEALERTALGLSIYQTINAPSRYTKTLLLTYYIAWCYANCPKANFIYTSHNVTLAAEQTEDALNIIKSPWYKSYFEVRISKSSSAKGNFKTIQGGHTIAIGADGAGVGRGAGLMDETTHAGALIMDDIIKPEEGFSASVRRRTARVYQMTLKNRRNNPNRTPIIDNSQRTNQGDMTGQLHGSHGNSPLDGEKVGKKWRDNALIIPALDEALNPLWPERHSKEWLLDLKQADPYTFASIYQQCPISDVSKIFNVEMLKELKEEPNFLLTFVTIDTAETAESYNDACAFSFWGLYEIEIGREKTGILGLHSINVLEKRIAAEDLVEEFESFYMGCMRHKSKPSRVVIEEMSTGVMLVAMLKNKPGLVVTAIKRSVASGSKINRLSKTAPFMAKGRISIMRDAPHKAIFKEHFSQITYDGSHKHDDIADTYADAVQMALIDKVLYNLDRVQKVNDASQQLIDHNQRILSSFN